MRTKVAGTPRRLARVGDRAPVLLRVITGAVRLAADEDTLFGGGGMPLTVADGIQNWLLPGDSIWICADAPAPAEIEIWLP